ncbi:MAG TPA: extracellular solute-binding protein, partial [Burkholderiales bacterium]|nr:extracellular solute-binding protein [Burkholderiales bacterium]
MKRRAALVTLLLAALRVGAALAEEEVVWYTAMNVPDAEALRKPFNERYPFIKLTLLRATGEKVRTRILTEAQAGRFAWDVVSFNLLDMDALERAGLLAPYTSPETASGYPPGAVGRTWAAIYVRQYVIGYNTQLVKSAPASWSDLLAPQWTGKLAL